jgi:hypothetical protein
MTVVEKPIPIPVGLNVTRLRAGDRVIGSFFEGWLGEEPDETKDAHRPRGSACKSYTQLCAA